MVVPIGKLVVGYVERGVLGSQPIVVVKELPMELDLN